ncbi:ParB/RepB/Spo0J family partition protein [Acidovorax cavernicola]|uniref:ParB/RepB/Spo0J family partition protein n=1 Tax=Acidovorax cavernicola TaxID=1675792 RepID=A0A9X8D050_9BURK|nr:ParB/RepB/Spo0J family partition protein [Acidovorax cavernicola]RIX74446.1 ParB/RepB/Spo0J family partition protein [Acidovorax cavernicola]
MTTITEKTCPGCKTCKPADQFNANKSRTDGLQRFCRACQKDLKADWQARNLDKTRQYDRDRKAPGKKATALYTAAPNPARASPLSGEGGEGEETTNVVETETAPPAAQQPAAAAAKDNPPAFGGEQEDNERLTAQPATPTVAKTTNTTGFADLPHAAIVRSKTNPRTHFDAEFIASLASSIRTKGVLQAILVRPLPGSRLQETLEDLLPGQPRPTHEVVAGEQRWRAAGIAGLRTIPAMIRELTDDQVLEIQLVENLKRRDLHPMEEAEGFERLRETAGLSAEDIADRIDKGRSYVYKTMNLLKLVPDARKAFYERKLTRSTAELVAMRPAGLQLQVLKDIAATDFHGEPMSYRKAKDHIDSNYMLKLGSAVFKITDESLVPAAGSCRTCPKRAGANPQLFDDVAHADTCTDPTCFNVKKQAHYDRIKAEAEERGQTVITGKEAKEIMPSSNTLRGYTKVDDHQALGGKMRTLRKVLGDNMPMPTLIEDPTTHEMVAVLPTAAVSKLLKDNQITDAGVHKEADVDAIVAKRKLTEAYELAWRTKAIRAVSEAGDADVALGTNPMREIALLLFAGLRGTSQALIGELANVGKVGVREGVEQHLKTVPADALVQWLYVLMMAHDLHQFDEHAVRISVGAANFGIDTKALAASVKSEMKAEASAKRVDEAAKTITAERKPAPARKPKVGKEEAAALIAKQLQAIDNPNRFEADQRVRLKSDVHKDGNTFNTRGVSATVVQAAGDRAWEVSPDNLNFPITVDYTEMEAL